MVLCGISHPFEWLSHTRGYVIHVLLTRSPLTRGPKSVRALDLHVLSTPPAFVLSQDQTLQFDSKNSLLLNDWVLVIGPKLFVEANSSNGCFWLVVPSRVPKNSGWSFERFPLGFLSSLQGDLPARRLVPSMSRCRCRLLLNASPLPGFSSLVKDAPCRELAFRFPTRANVYAGRRFRCQ